MSATTEPTGGLDRIIAEQPDRPAPRFLPGDYVADTRDIHSGAWLVQRVEWIGRVWRVTALLDRCECSKSEHHWRPATGADHAHRPVAMTEAQRLEAMHDDGGLPGVGR